MIPFKIPPWRKKLINQQYKLQDKTINRTVSLIRKIVGKAIDYIVDQYFKTDQYYQPDLYGLNGVIENFYRDIIEKSYHHSIKSKDDQVNKKKLAKAPVGVPKKIKNINEIFGNSKYWDKIINRSNKLTDKMKKGYLQRLKKTFEKASQHIQNGDLHPGDLKDYMMESWHASKERVETIFRTETTNYFSKVQISFFSGDKNIIGFIFDSVKDRARTNICKSRHGLIYRPNTSSLTENTPALHFNCRSHLIPLANTKYNLKLLEDKRRNPEFRAVVPLPKGWRK